MNHLKNILLLPFVWYGSCACITGMEIDKNDAFPFHLQNKSHPVQEFKSSIEEQPEKNNILNKAIELAEIDLKNIHNFLSEHDKQINEHDKYILQQYTKRVEDLRSLEKGLPSPSLTSQKLRDKIYEINKKYLSYHDK